MSHALALYREGARGSSVVAAAVWEVRAYAGDVSSNWWPTDFAMVQNEFQALIIAVLVPGQVHERSRRQH